MKLEVRFGGSGGQGVVLAARILGEAAVMDGKNALQTQQYGAEARGSLTKSEVIISDAKIGFPAVRKSDVLATMSQEATDKMLKDLKESGTLIVDSSNVASVPEVKATVFSLPITETARRTPGGELRANMVMLGAFTRITGVVTRESVEVAIRGRLSQSAEANLRAFWAGYEMKPDSCVAT